MILVCDPYVYKLFSKHTQNTYHSGDEKIIREVQMLDHD